jgi:hypothetical protein
MKIPIIVALFLSFVAAGNFWGRVFESKCSPAGRQIRISTYGQWLRRPLELAGAAVTCVKGNPDEP